MNSFGEYLRNKREQQGLPLRKVAAELDIDTSILSKIERNERMATKEMLPTLSKTLEVQEKENEIHKCNYSIGLRRIKIFENRLEETLNAVSSRM